MTSQKIVFTEITDHLGEINKVISFDPRSRKIKKDGKAAIWNGHSEQKEMLFADLPEYISSLLPSKAITLGTSDYKSIPVVVTGNENPPHTISRSKKYFEFSPDNQLLFFDYDSRGDEQDISPDEFIDIISDIIPDFKYAAKVLNYSASSFIFDQKGKKVNNGDGFHIYFIVKDSADIERFYQILFKRLWINGYGHIQNSSDGKQLLRTIFDTSVFSPERLDFVAGAVCMDGLFQKKPKPKYFEGSVLDTQSLKDLNEDEEEKYLRIVELKKDKNKPVSVKISEKYDKEETDNLIKRGNPPHKVKNIILNRRRQSLMDEDIVTFDDGSTISVKELLDNGVKYDGRTMYDPLEPEQGVCKSCFFWNQGKHPLINSFIHGERVFKFYRFTHPGNRNRGIAKGNEPTYPVDHFYSPDEAKQKLIEIIEDFITTRKDTAVLYEAGGGKTSRAIEKIAEEYEKKRGRFKVAYFVNSHPTADERRGDFKDEVDIPSIIQKLADTLNKKGDGIAIISGFDRKCLHPVQKEIGLDKEYCKGCFYNAVEHICPYINQYGQIGRDGKKKSLDVIRIYQHAHLFQPSSEDYGWEPDFIVVDEDVVGNMVQIVSMKKSSNPVITEIIEAYGKNSNLLDILKQKKGAIKRQLHLLFDQKKPTELSKDEMKVKTALNILKELSSYDPLLRIAKPSGQVWIEDDCLYVGWLRRIHEKWQNKPILYLDASGSQEIISRCLRKDFDFHKIRCAYQKDVEVIQVENLSLSKNWLRKKNNLQNIKDLIALFDSKETGFISYKNVKDAAGNSTSFISTLISDKERCGWFGDIRGSNDFEDLSTLVVIGRRKIGDPSLGRIAKVIYGDDGLWLSSEQKVTEKTIRMKNKNHLTLKNYEYVDERLRLVSDHSERSETYQAIHRLRLVWRDKPKRVIFVSNEVVDITVDRLITFEDLLKGMIQFEDWIMNVGVWNYSDNDGMEKETGIPKRTIIDLKNSDSKIFSYIELDVREIKTSRKKIKMKFIVHRKLLDNQDKLVSGFLTSGYKLIEIKTGT